MGKGSWAAEFQRTGTPRETQFAYLHPSGADAPQPAVPARGAGGPGLSVPGCGERDG